jgi:hypothetical protein
MLANSVGIIDRAYTGTILVALIKVDPHAADIQLPFCCVQMILRPVHHFQVVEIPESMLDATDRGSDGFGSTEVRAALKETSVSNVNSEVTKQSRKRNGCAMASEPGSKKIKVQ